MAHRAAIKGREHSTERIESRSLFRDYVKFATDRFSEVAKRSACVRACVVSFLRREELGKEDEENKIVESKRAGAKESE